jgi:uncharacterized protein YcbK (DUF882 family)
MMAFGLITFATSFASAQTRSLKLYFIHTGEKAEIVYKRNGRYDLAKINRFLRDWRRNEPTKMDPRLLDVIWETYRSVGARGYIHVVSAYRSPATNSMLRKRSKGVANKSQHMLGKAMDFYIPGVSLKKLRDTGLRIQAGGVGYYPRSGSPFVHMDVGNVRHWPRMSRRELAAVFPNGKTLHVPTDGKPLPGFEQALASYKSRRTSGNLAIASARTTGSGSRGFLAAFFGGGADEEEDTADAGTAVAAVAAPKATATAKAEPAKRAPVKPAPEKPVAVKPSPEKPVAVKQVPNIRIVPPELATPAVIPPAQVQEPAEQTPEAIIAALPKRSIPVPGAAPRPRMEVGAQPENIPFQVVAEADMAADPAAQPTEVALGIPLPTHRPKYTPAVLTTSGDNAVAALLAMSEPLESEATASVPMPSTRPIVEGAEFVVAALPESRPSLAPLSETNPVAVAPADAANASPDENPFGIAPADAVAAPGKVAPAAKGARLTVASASPRSALTARKPGLDPASALSSGVKTTQKSAKPRVRDGKPEPRPIVIAAQPQAARWAFDADYVRHNTQDTTAPSFAYNIVRTAPREVYTAGFQQETKVSDANRFSGKAVTFLSVARFKTN